MSTAATAYPVHELIASRWSPYTFDSRPVPAGDLASLFEAARWAASSYNEQPWRFIVATKDNPQEFEKLLSIVVSQNREWARTAPVLVLGIAKRVFTHNGKENRSALHDLGQAAASLTLEATARGLYVHQMAGILPEIARNVYAIPEDYEVFTALAIGYLGEDEVMKSRTRKPLNDLVFSGSWGQPARLPS